MRGLRVVGVLGVVGTLVGSACGGGDVTALSGCPSGQKGCLVDGRQTCVGTDDPNYGCSAASCEPCGSLGFMNVKTASCHPVLRTCTVSACNEGFAHCEGDLNRGCETSLLVSDKFCGSCTNSCLAIQAPNTAQNGIHCMNGRCLVTECTAGFTDCDTVPTNGCECPTTKTCMNRQCI